VLMMVDFARESLSFWNELTRIVIHYLITLNTWHFFYWNGGQVTWFTWWTE
jgi:hypothetical protein